jgi:hypothetical protein
MKPELSSGNTPCIRSPGRWLLLVLAVACCVPDVVFAQLFGSNLIVNGNAESGPGSTDGSTQPIPNAPGWAVTGNFLINHYNIAGGFPLTSDPGSPTRANNYFCGGDNNASSTAAQSINVAAGTASIDAAGVAYNLSGWLGGFSNQDDNATLTVTFRNAGAAAIGTASIGPVKSTDRANATGMLFRSTSGFVPVGTRTIDVVLQMTRDSGSFNDGYADDLSLVLSTFNSQSDCLFNWAERNFPTLFAPAGAISNTFAPYYYRLYPQTGAILATSSADHNVYYVGPLSGNSILSVGALSGWLTTSGCQ